MTNNDWSNLGNNIRDIVQDAIDSQDFNKLNETINQTINNTVQTVGKTLKSAGKAVDENMKEYTSAYKTPSFKKKSVPARTESPSLFLKTTSSKAGGMALAITGFTFSLLTGIALMVLAIVGMVRGSFPMGFQIASFILTPFFLGSLFMASSGLKALGRVKRFRQYVQALHGKAYCQITEFTHTVRKSANFIKKDLQDMISRGWFREGHLDSKGTYLMVSHESYEQYQLACQSAIERQHQEMLKQEHMEEVPSDVQSIVAAGQEYLRKIHASNDAIPGVEISGKISRMEVIIQKIFQRVEQNPDSASELHKLMDYYLPTTVKLLEAYAHLDAQPIQGENIQSSKKEIEGTLDTLNHAFEKLLDSLFKDTAWDVSSDISVLHTLLAQEGLTENDFRKGE